MPATIQNNRISLAGDWSTGGIADQYPHILRELAKIATVQPTAPELDLSAVSALDACGCQMLAALLGALRQHGLTPASASIPEELRKTIRMMGFSALFSSLEQPA